MRFRSLSLVLPLALGLLAGCGDERDPLSYVQADVLEKSFFVGEDLLDPSDDPEFYTQATLIDVGYGAAQDGLFTSTYGQILSRIKWVIQEDSLLARLTYERIDSSDGKGAGAASNDGIVVASFRIRSHFDIQRRYNPTTGEKSNVIEENTTDRPWYARRYMRVDWSKNENTDNYDFDMLALLGVYGGVKYDSSAYYVNDPTHEDAPHFDLEAGYFDVTTKAFARPQNITIDRWNWSAPACLLPGDVGGGTSPSGQCSSVELTIRLAFRKIVENDYEPQHWDGRRFSAYGAFYTERYGYARNYGMTDAQWLRLVNRYNLWHRSHYYANPDSMEGAIVCDVETPIGGQSNLDVNGNGTADECEQVTELTGFAGSQCDIFNQKCTLPYRAREALIIPWYFSNGSNQEYFDGTEWATHEWDVAMRSAVITSRYTECVRTGDEFPSGDVPGRLGDPKKCAAKYTIYNGQADDNADAIALATEVDNCRRANGYDSKKEGECAALADSLGALRRYEPGVIALAKQPELIVLCHSPVESGDHPACGGPRLPEDVTAADCDQARDDRNMARLEICNQALNARRGDIRYHMVNVIKTPQTPSPWGIMVDAVDPLTGQKVAASINVWSHVTDMWTQGLIDTARYIRGELSDEDVTEGKYINDWASAAERVTAGSLPRMERAELDKQFATMLRTTPERIAQVREQTATVPAFERAIADGDAKIREAYFAPDAAGHNRIIYDARRNLATGSAMEAQLITPAMQQYAGATGLSSSIATQMASPLRTANPSVEREIKELRDAALARRGSCIMEAEAPAPLALANLASQLESKFGAFNPSDEKVVQYDRVEKMRRYLAQKAHFSVVLHEMGHSIGLRHNFVSSSDPMWYRPQYWQLRTKDGSQNTLCSSLDPTGACVGPRYFDPVTEEEKDNLIWMWMHSSTMDYAGEITQDLLGLGAYDFAATRMVYGENVSVFNGSTFLASTPRGRGMLDKVENYGGITGIRYSIGATYSDGTPGLANIHYSELQRLYQLISDCKQIDPNDFKPSNWNVERDGEWSPLLDGQIVKINGKHTRCRQQPVDYRSWDVMGDTLNQYDRIISHALDPEGRVRVPYGFATDNRADIGNLSVYRHDNGADPYELFDFFITQQEVGHIFDNYRRGRPTFTVRGAATRSLQRFNAKMRDGAKGLGLMVNYYKDIAVESRFNYDEFWEYVSTRLYPDNLLASGIAFDHFTRMLQRPEAGPHYLPNFAAADGDPPIFAEDGVWRSGLDSRGPTLDDDQYALVMHNGATGRYGNVSWGGRPIENALSESDGEYESEYTMNVGSYYEKAYTAMLLTESVDNFVSASRSDFVDARYRSVSLADLFPDAYRRWLASNLTGDDRLKGVWLPAEMKDGVAWPLTDEATRFPAKALGYTTWLPADGPKACFTGVDALGGTAPKVKCGEPTGPVIVVEPQIGWEQQKFLIAWTLLYLPENEKQYWLNMLNIWELGADSDPGFVNNRIEFHDPFGKIYVAKTFGKETLFAGTEFEQTVQKGVAARILEYANNLLAEGYEADPVDFDGDGVTDWYRARLNSDGLPIIKFDPTMRSPTDGLPTSKPGCEASDNSKCTCELNRACMALRNYTEVPYFLRQAMAAYGLADPSMKGIY